MIVCPWKDIGRYEAVIPGLKEAIAALEGYSFTEPTTLPLSGSNKILLQENTTKPAGAAEAHREFLDVQYILEGGETVGWADVATMTLEGEFNTVKDKGTYTGKMEFLHIPAGYCYVVFPEDAHAPGVHLDAPEAYKKAVIKLKV